MSMKRESPGPSAAEPPRKRPLAVDVHGRPRFQGCVNIRNYEFLGKLGEGTFGEVHKARNVASGKLFAMKKILMPGFKEEGFPITALREIKILKMLSHKNVVQLVEMAIERKKDRGTISRGTVYMVTPYMDHDLAGLLENPDVVFTEPQIKCYMLQLLEGTKYLHENHILHRDMKAANLLIDNRGILQIADFGLARKFEEPVPVAGGGGGIAKRVYTNCVVTRWYRPPELLLGERKYTSAIDLWGVGCVFAEMYHGKPILQGNSDMDQIVKIFQLCGSPNEKNMPEWDRLPGCDGVSHFGPYHRTLEGQFSKMGSAGVSLLPEFLKLDPKKRINAIDALKHEYFSTEPLPAKPGELPRFEESHELDRKKFRNQKALPPPAPAGGTVGVGQNNTEWERRTAELPYGAGGGPGQGRRQNDQWNSGNNQRYGRHHDSRVPQSHDRAPPSGHRAPPWSRGPPADTTGHRDPGLPPRPPPSRNSRSGGNNLDTYIPSYDRNRSGWDRDRGGSRDRGDWRDRSGHDRGYNASGGQRRSSSRDRHRDNEPVQTNIYRR
ncbi:serine/threonine protein kinase, CMGC, CDC2/CDK subfamily [Rhizina undulata]